MQNCFYLASLTHIFINWAMGLGLPWWLTGKEYACQAGDDRVEKVFWRREWQPTPAFLPGESHGQSGLVGYSPWGHKESDTTE